MCFRRRILLILCILNAFFAFSQPPSGYYDAVAGLDGQALKTALYNIIKNHTVISYDGLWNAFQTTDDKTNGKVWDMYSDVPGGTPAYEFTFISDQCGSYNSEGDCYNREHSFPKSWFNDASPMYSDLFHLYPTDGYVNGHRSNYPFGETGNASWTSTNGSKVGNNNTTGYSGIVFEPRDEYKGDFARTYFYMATRYENVIANWENYDVNGNAVLDGTSFPCFEPWCLQLLMTWHQADPVNQKEIDRNNTIYTNFQHNRNPYIDHPEYVDLIWGDGNGPQQEPSSYPADFAAHNIRLHWTDATGDVVPAGYLIRMSAIGYQDIANPIDGIIYPDCSNDQNIPYGVQSVWFKNLNTNSLYYFKIFPFSGSGNNIDYKTDGAVPQLQVRTGK